MGGASLASSATTASAGLDNNRSRLEAIIIIIINEKQLCYTVMIRPGTRLGTVTCVEP
jgi:hypothetical protein